MVTKKRQREGSNGTALVGYEDIGAEAFGAPGRAVVATSMYIELMGTCALLFILEVGMPPPQAHLMDLPPSGYAIAAMLLTFLCYKDIVRHMLCLGRT